MNSEEMARAGRNMQAAAGEILQASYNIEECTRRLECLFGQGYGSNLDSLIEALNSFKIDKGGEQ